MFHTLKRMKIGNSFLNGDQNNWFLWLWIFFLWEADERLLNGVWLCRFKIKNTNYKNVWKISAGHVSQRWDRVWRWCLKRKEPDSGRGENRNSLNLANAAGGVAKPVNPPPVFTTPRIFSLNISWCHSTKVDSNLNIRPFYLSIERWVCMSNIGIFLGLRMKSDGYNLSLCYIVAFHWLEKRQPKCSL